MDDLGSGADFFSQALSRYFERFEFHGAKLAARYKKVDPDIAPLLYYINHLKRSHSRFVPGAAVPKDIGSLTEMKEIARSISDGLAHNQKLLLSIAYAEYSKGPEPSHIALAQALGNKALPAWKAIADLRERCKWVLDIDGTNQLSNPEWMEHAAGAVKIHWLQTNEKVPGISLTKSTNQPRNPYSRFLCATLRLFGLTPAQCRTAHDNHRKGVTSNPPPMLQSDPWEPSWVERATRYEE